MESEDVDVVPDACEYEAPQMGVGLGATTRLTPLGFLGLSAGGGGAITKKFVIDDEEALAEEERRSKMEVKRYEMLLKRAQVESMKTELDKLSLQKTNLSGFSDGRYKGGHDIQARHREAQGGRVRLQAWRC